MCRPSARRRAASRVRRARKPSRPASHREPAAAAASQGVSGRAMLSSGPSGSTPPGRAALPEGPPAPSTSRQRHRILRFVSSCPPWRLIRIGVRAKHRRDFLQPRPQASPPSAAMIIRRLFAPSGALRCLRRTQLPVCRLLPPVRRCLATDADPEAPPPLLDSVAEQYHLYKQQREPARLPPPLLLTRCREDHWEAGV